MTRPGVGKPVVLLALLCALLMPLSNATASGAAVSLSDSQPDDPFAHGAFIQHQIMHLATHPRAGVPFLTAFLTEAERLCQPHARQFPGGPCPNVASAWLLEASAIALPARWALAETGSSIASLAVTPSAPAGREPPPDLPPPKFARFGN